MLFRAAHYSLSMLCVGASMAGCELGSSPLGDWGARANHGLANLRMRLSWRSH